MSVGETSSVSAAVMRAAIPADVRSEGAGAVKGYQAALQFESMLLKEMLTGALPESPAGAGIGGENEEEEGAAMTADPTTTTLPETVAESVVGAGGLGLAKQMYTSFEGSTSIKGATK
jgi:hypothetical protein